MRVRVTAAPVRSYRTLSPLPVRDSRAAAPSAVCSLRHFPAGFPGGALPTALALWCPDFPRRLLSLSPRLPSSRRTRVALKGGSAEPFRPVPAGCVSGERGAAGGAATALQLSMTYRAVRPALSRQGLPGAEDLILERRLRR